VYFAYLHYKELKYTNTLRKELDFVPYMLSLEQVYNIQLYYQKPETLKAKIYGEITTFFKNIEKVNKNSYFKTGCFVWSKKSKNIFKHYIEEGKSLYKIDDEEYRYILNGINFMDKFCNDHSIKR